MSPPASPTNGDPVFVTQFYYSRAFPYLMEKWREEIRRRLIDVPDTLRLRELAPPLIELGEAGGDVAWEIFRRYLDKIENCVAETVRGHSPSFWFHLHRRIRPMLAEFHISKTDDVTVRLVRRIAELAYAKHGNLARTDDLGPILRTRLETFLDGAWYEATARALGSKLRAKKEYQQIKWTQQVVMIDFRASDLCDVFGIEGLCYEYWWASAAMRSIGKGSLIKWDGTKRAPISYRDDRVNPLCFDLYDRRNAENNGFRTRLGTWLDDVDQLNRIDATRGDQIHFAQLRTNPAPQEYPVWNKQTGSMGRGFGATNFEIGTFSLATFEAENSFMAEPFERKHGVKLEVVLFAIWVASFFGVYSGLTSSLRSVQQQLDRTLSNWSNLLFRGYSMTAFHQKTLAQEAIWWAKQLNYKSYCSVEDALQGIKFISLNDASQKNIGLWSGGKRPIFIPSMDGLLIDLAGILPFLETIFFGLRKVAQIGGSTFEDSVRSALRSRQFEVCLQGPLRWQSGNPREVDVAVRTGDKLILIECFSYELPLDYDAGKPSVFDRRKGLIQKKVEQARSLAERISREPKGVNFDVSWAKMIDWRVVSPFVEFAWQLTEPLYDDGGLPRVLQVRELVQYLTDGTMPSKSLMPLLKEMRDFDFRGNWY